MSSTSFSLVTLHGRLVGLEFWRASAQLPEERLAMLPAPPRRAAG
jgi:hypothetical protein